MGRRVRRWGRSGSCVLQISRSRVASEGLLRGAKPALHSDQEFSFFDARAGEVFRVRALLLARGVYDHANRQGRGVSRIRPSAVAAPVSGFARPRVGRGPITISFSGAPAHFQNAPPQLEGVSRAAGRAFDRSAEGCRTVSGLLVLIPAYNEEGAIGGVVNEVRAVMPGVGVLVVDDCSGDATIHIARAAGARVLSL